MTATAERGAARPEVETPVLEFDDVRLSFAGVKAIDGVSFTVGGNELFAHHRPERRRQDLDLQRAVRGVSPAVGPGHLRGHRSNRQASA